jgi:adenylate cyclase
MDLHENSSVTLGLGEFKDMDIAMKQMKQGLKNFEKFVPGDVVRTMLRMNVGVQLGVVPKRLTVMFLDIVSFTTISESVSPTDLIYLMSRFFTEMSEAVKETGGTIDKFIGDCVM